MGSIFRSEEMALVQLFIQSEAAYYTISELGEAGIVQFKDLNGDMSAFQRKFVNEVRRCDEMERILRYIETEIKKDKITIPEPSETPRAPNPREIIDLEAHLEKTEGDIKELSDNETNLKTNLVELMELQQVLEKTRTIFNEQDEHWSSTMESRALIIDETNASGIAGQHLSFVAGVIDRERIPAFERMLWRVSRGNVLLKQAPIEKALEDPATGQQVLKTVFAIFFQGEQLKIRVNKICTGFHARLYMCPSVKTEREELENNLKVRVEDLTTVLNRTNDHRRRVLTTVTKELYNWSVMVKKMKAIYHTLNMFNMDISTKCLIGECWIPVRERATVQLVLNDGFNQSGSSIPSFLNVVPTMETPPTFHNTNKFSRGFQNLVDSYGVASYREVNPALYTIITFPFLFAVMFGDAGHGLIVLLFGLFMVLNEKKIIAQKSTGEIAKIFFGGRYIILLMGFFSIYTGLIYNDIFSKSVNIFQSSWFVPSDTSIVNSDALQLHPKDAYKGSPYEFGIDPVWQISTNKIIFLNSYKMKLSIIFGVIHMIFGVCLSVANHTHFGNYSSIFLEFLPQLIFLILIFLWMVVMMFMKWIMFSASFEPPYSPGCAPSILILFINMMLFKSSEPLQGCNEYIFDGQKELQLGLFAGAIVCIPVMLLGKPIYLKFSKKPKGHDHMSGNSNGDVNGMELQPNSTGSHEPASHGHDHGTDMGEILITQAIHTIEYVLSTISHTASYLRLWALSLAHQQLSEVLWNMVMRGGFGFGLYISAPVLFIIFAAWAGGTVAILVLMEGLSAFLHTLRLHWVEFMSKFYIGAGYAFIPFSFKRILDEEEELDK